MPRPIRHPLLLPTRPARVAPETLTKAELLALVRELEGEPVARTPLPFLFIFAFGFGLIGVGLGWLALQLFLLAQGSA